MNTRHLMIAIAAAGALGAASYGLYQIGMQRGMQMAALAPATAMSTGAGSNVDPEAGKKVLYWHDPMVPGQKFDKPGKSPFMDMQLVPVYADAGGDEGKVTISPRMQQNLGVRTAEVTTGTLTQKLEAVGSVAYNDRDVAVVTARVGGYVERLYVRALLDPVRKGQPLAELFAPEWVATQEEYLSVRRMQGAGTEALAASARQRMLLAGMSEDQVRQVESSGKAQPRVTLNAPTGGVIAELGAREGMTVMAGAMLFRINGLGSVWVNAEIPESRAAMIRPGNNVEVRTATFPELTMKGRVAAILPEVSPATRTLKARVEVSNPGGLLAPGMFASVDFTPSSRANVLLVPSEAVIQTGERKVVIVAQVGGRFRPVDVETGADTNGQTEIRKGLEAGQKVVLSGQFLIDSEASLRGAAMRMGESTMSEAGQTAQKIHHGKGVVLAISARGALIKHEDIPSAGMGAMTMEYLAPKSGIPENVKKGDNIEFAFTMNKDGESTLATITPAAAPLSTQRAPNAMKDMKQ